MKKSITILLQSLIAMIPVIYILAIWNNMPESLPMHFNAKFEVDNFGSKSEMLALVIFISALVIGVSLLINNLHRFDPKRKFQGYSILMAKISWTLTVFLTIISLFMIYVSANYPDINTDWHKYFLAILALLFVALGNLINNVKPNYFVGIRVPWTLDNEENWRMTHHLGSRIFFFGGLLMFILILSLPGQFASYIMAFGMIPMVVIPVGYSYYIFRQKKKSSGVH